MLTFIMTLLRIVGCICIAFVIGTIVGVPLGVIGL
jgi:hypothetical protein